MAGNLVVGTPDCSFLKVLDVMKEDFPEIKRRWVDWAYELQLSSIHIMELKHQVMSDKLSFYMVVRSILIVWRGQNYARDATLQILIESLKRCDLLSCAANLEISFGLSTPGETGRQEEEETRRETNENLEEKSDELEDGTTAKESPPSSPKNDEELILPVNDEQTPCLDPYPVGPILKSKKSSGIAALNLDNLDQCSACWTLLDWLGSIVEVSPFSYADKESFVLKIRQVSLIILCCLTTIFSGIDIYLECIQFNNHVKGTNNVGAFLRFVFLYLGFKIRKFVKTLKEQEDYIDERYKKILHGKHYWISFLSIIIVNFFSSTGLWMVLNPKNSEKDILSLVGNNTNVSETYFMLITILYALIRFVLLLVEQYAMDMVLVVAYVLNNIINTFLGDVIKLSKELIKGTRKPQLSQATDRAQELPLDLAKSSVNTDNQEEIPMQNLSQIEIAIEPKPKPVKTKCAKTRQREISDLQYDYGEVRIIFRSANKLIGELYSILLFVALLLVSSFEDTLLGSSNNIIDKLEYAFVFVKIVAIVYIGCRISNTLGKVLRDEYAILFVPIPNELNDGQNIRQQPANRSFAHSSSSRHTERQYSEDFDLSSVPQVGIFGNVNPIGLGNHPFTMNTKFLAHHLGLALFTIFLGIVSTRDKESGCHDLNNINNSLAINGNSTN